MADTVVNFLLNNLSQLLKDEAKLLFDVEGKVKLLQQELERINAFLRGSEGKRDEHETVKIVVRQIRDLAYEAQDVIDNYVVDVVNHRRKGMLEKFFSGFDHAKMLHSVNNQIEIIKSKIKDIYDNKDKYGINEGDSLTANMEALAVAEKVQSRRNNVEEDEVVGFDEYADEVTKLIVKGNTSLEVVSIVGMVGCGKTTLARKVYRDPQLNNLFDCCSWDFVTEQFNAKELLLSLLRRFKAISEDELKRNNKDNKEKESESTAKVQEIAMLKNTLRDYLSDMRYLIVLDDVWSSQVLEEIGDAFPDDNMGSRIVITTRSEEAALKISTIEPYKLKRLSDEDSWILLSKKVFRGEKCPPTLEIAGRKIAIACKGLPLSLVVTAGILRSKEKSERVWEKVMGNVNWYINREDTLVQEIVRLSYESLPRRLKSCFLYFGIYPEDYEISVRQLIQLWMAEGLIIPETGHETMIQEDVAEEYLEELIRRNLIQVESRRTDGGVKTCRIHDLLRELCMSKSIEDHFLEVRTDISILKEGKPRRLSLHGSTAYYMSESPCDHSVTRSLFSFNKDEYNASRFQDWLRKNFKLIRVLDMGHMKNSNQVLSVLEELIHLKYVRTRDDSLTFFPNSIYCLWNIETLDLRGSRFYDLPDGIWKLKRLRHLHMSGTRATLPNIPGRKIMSNLQTLSVVCLDKKTAQQLEKGKFPNLRKLGVDLLYSDSDPNPMEYLQRLQQLSHLNTLKVIWGKCALTSVGGFPPNITKITLVGGNYLSENTSLLGSLPKLRYLKISEGKSDCLTKFKLKCIESECFPQLQVLKMTGLNCVSWNLGEGAMPQLRRLVINRCEFSTSLSGAESFTALQEVEVLWSSKDVVNKLQHIVLKDACKLTVYPALDE